MASYTTYVVKNKAQLRILRNTMRSRILRIMRKAGKPMTVQMVAEELGEKHGNIFYHVKKLIDADLIELVKTETVNGIIAKYYLRKYDLIYVSPDVRKEIASENPAQYREYRTSLFSELTNEYLEQIHPHDIPLEDQDSYDQDKFNRGYYNFDPNDIDDIARAVDEVFNKYNNRTLNTERFVTLRVIGKQRKDIYKPLDEVRKDEL